MKVYIKSSTSTGETIIRMTLNDAAAERRPGSSIMLKLRFLGLDPDISLIVAAALQLIGNYEDITNYPPSLDDSKLNKLVEIAQDAGILTAEDAEEYLDGTDLGSGEPIIFSVRHNGKLVYRSGLRESQFGKMGSMFDNDEVNELSTEDMYKQYRRDIENYMAKLGGLSFSDEFETVTEYSRYKQFAIYKEIPCANGPSPLFIFDTIPDKSTFSYDQRSSEADKLRLRRSAKQFDKLNLVKIDPSSISNVPVLEHCKAPWDRNEDVVWYGTVSSKSALKRAQANGSKYVYVESKYI